MVLQLANFDVPDPFGGLIEEMEKGMKTRFAYITDPDTSGTDNFEPVYILATFLHPAFKNRLGAASKKAARDLAVKLFE